MNKPEILSALTTPFTPDGGIDAAGFQSNLARLEPLVDGVFVGGTTGEFLALTPAEHAGLVTQALSVFGPDRVVVHVGAPSTRQSLELTRESARLGAVRFAAITPYYLPASPAGITRHWGAIKEVCGGDLYGYVYPDVAVTDLLPDDLPLVLSSGIDGLKTSATAAGRVREYLAQVPEGFRLWSGNDADLPNVMAAGGTGTVSGCSSVCPGPWAAWRDAQDNEARATAQAIIEAIVPVLGPSIANLKLALDLQGLAGGACRMPIDSPSPEVARAVAVAVDLSRDMVAARG